MFKIRPAVKNDAPAIALVHRDAVFSKASNYYPPDLMNEWSPGATPDRIIRLEGEIADPTLIVLVAEAGSDIIGFALAAPAKNELVAVYVKPNTVGEVGQRLLKELEDRAFSSCEYLACDASLNAEDFYKKNGYSVEGRAEHKLRSGRMMPCIRIKKLRPKPMPQDS